YPTCSNNNPWRVTHTWSTPEVTHAGGFQDFIAIGSVSPIAAYNQYFVPFTSNMEGQVGCQDGTLGSGPSGQGWNQCTGAMDTVTFYSCTGCSVTGAVGTTCTLSGFSNGSGANGSGNVVTATLGTLNTLDANATFTVTTVGTNISWSGPTTANVSNGTTGTHATCSDGSHTLRIAVTSTNPPRYDAFIASVPIASG